MRDAIIRQVQTLQVYISVQVFNDLEHTGGLRGNLACNINGAP